MQSMSSNLDKNVNTDVINEQGENMRSKTKREWRQEYY